MKWSTKVIKEIRKPKDGEKIYFVNTFGVVDECVYDSSDEMLDKLVNCGNYYFTQRDAEFASLREKYCRLYKKYIDEFGGGCDWTNERQSKWFGYWDATTNQPKVSCGSTIKLPCEYSTDADSIMDAIEFIDEENFKRYVINLSSRDLLMNNNLLKDFGDGEDAKYMELENCEIDNYED